jgi:malonate decarboxylase delta subunit
MGDEDTMTEGLETLDFTLAGRRALPATFAPVLVGVVGSGNCEVLLEAAAGTARDACTFRIETSARGYGPIWEAVVRDFHTRNPIAGARIAINDMGATPAVVSLRLDQAAAGLAGDAP